MSGGKVFAISNHDVQRAALQMGAIDVFSRNEISKLKSIFETGWLMLFSLQVIHGMIGKLL